MPKNIVICCDGTWNTPDQQDGGVLAPTNVFRLHSAVAASNTDGVAQHKYYHPGVGTDGSWVDKKLGGGTGRGLDQNIMSAYYDLARRYAPGDKVFLFGFSRGAYTVRSLAGFISCAGLLDLSKGQPDSQTWAQIELMFDNGYRRKTDYDLNGFKLSIQPRTEDAVHFLGVWDTVGALGIPDDMALLNLLDSLHDHRFHDTELGKTVRHARHAVAMDEMRAAFQPTLWRVEPGRDAVEMWFPGVHSDVGGGYQECGLSDGALLWMILEAQAKGLAFIPQLLPGDPKTTTPQPAAISPQIRPDPHDVLHDSCNGVFALLPTSPRSVPQLPDGGSFHPSVAARHGVPAIRQGAYREQRTTLPQEINIYARDPWTYTGIWLQKGVTYGFTALGEWIDGGNALTRVKCGPGGTNDGVFYMGELGQAAGSVFGAAEALFKKLTGNDRADFRLTRRHENAPWMCLMGAVANGGAPDAKGRLLPHESFIIGASCNFTPKASGYLYAYANDAWGRYGNNSGHVRLTVKLVTPQQKGPGKTSAKTTKIPAE